MVFIQRDSIAFLPALPQYIRLDLQEGERIGYLGNLYESYAMLLAGSLFAPVVSPSLFELTCRIVEVIDRPEMLQSLMFKSNTKNLAVSIQFHLVTVAVE